MATTYLFFADGELKVFLSELIAQQYCQDGPQHLLTFTPRIEETWDLYPWTSRTRLPWSHKDGSLRNYWKKAIEKYWHIRQRIHHIQKTVGDLCEGADEVVIHTYQIYSERLNYLFHYLYKRFPGITIRTRLIPDGTLNLTRRPMTGVRKLPQLFNTLKWIGDSRIQPYYYSGDRLGADADVTDRIYLPKGFPNEYEPSKVHWIDMPRSADTATNGQRPKRALVVGTAMIQINLCSRNDMDLVSQRTRSLLKQLGVTEIYYKPHHKEPHDQLEICETDYQIMETKKCIERILLEEQFDVLVGHCSTSLITARLMYEDLPVYSVGQDLVELRSRKGASIHRYRGVCEKLNIPLVPVLDEDASQQTPEVRKAA